MSLNFDAVINTPEYSVDMKAGLTSLLGTSDAIRCIAETTLTGEVPERQSHKGSVRTQLKNTFSGSYGQIFSLEIADDGLTRKFNAIGHQAFAEIISYYFSDAIYGELKPLSDKAQRVIDKLGDTSEALTEQLRKSAIKNAHEVSKFKHEIKIRYRKNRDDQTILATFNSDTAKTLEAKKSKETVELTASITRLNIHTGNGRLQIQGEEETTAFGFASKYKEVKIEAKKMFSTNLDHNNGIEKSDWKYVRIIAAPITLRDGKVIKYIVSGFYK
ncbi:hypothetical protein [Pollutimonas bauzanensis]|uniref:Uncharacterized protein n=1 Tax=Pollutimonas bauzanensis TaxID=658167 RepID=A0A1M5Q1W0_9BURK|nr:hypothetical protein [Pollutimonas bauzanensis]SHH08287.1 hypothetical protein SAMN04488135_102139 [Pollutimonas bauzanensis]